MILKALSFNPNYDRAAVALAGGWYLPSQLPTEESARLINSPSYQESDVDIFIGTDKLHRGVRLNYSITDIVINVVRAFGGILANDYTSPESASLFTPTPFPRTREEHYDDLPGVLRTLRFNVPLTPEENGARLRTFSLNIIFTDRLGSTSTIQDAATLVSNFDLDILRSCSMAVTGGMQTFLYEAESSFEAKVSKLVSGEDISPERRQKYEDRLRPLGYTFSWELE